MDDAKMLGKLLLGVSAACIVLFVFWQQDRVKFRHACQVMRDPELHLPDAMEPGTPGAQDIEWAFRIARFEAECPDAPNNLEDPLDKQTRDNFRTLEELASPIK